MDRACTQSDCVTRTVSGSSSKKKRRRRERDKRKGLRRGEEEEDRKGAEKTRLTGICERFVVVKGGGGKG